MEVIDIVPQDVHGGSMRYVIAHKNELEVSDRVKDQQVKEKLLGLDKAETFKCLARHIERSRGELISVLQELKAEGESVVGYGATSKSTTVINYCGITPDLVRYISDTTPIKQGKYSPGGHIPIRPYESFCADYPDVALLFAWNHAEEIMSKEKRFLKSGGKWLTYIPKVEVIG
jgi:methylation protein EvaC